MTKTVTIRLLGGLGNQMFQYAAGRSLAHRHGARLRLDPSYIGFEAHREFALDTLSIEAKVSRRRKVPAAVFDRTVIDERIARLRFAARIERERKHTFNPEFEQAPANAYLIGYWQCERYFAPVAEEIRAEFRPRSLSAVARETAAQIEAAPSSVAVHVRRGDYISNTETNRLLGVCSAGFYERAAEVVGQRCGDATFWVFSDDPDWCAENLRLPGETTIVSGRTAAHEDLHLMTLCHHNIIANSSFSWWGAWLGERESSVVVAPKKWFDEIPVDYSEIVPERWCRI